MGETDRPMSFGAAPRDAPAFNASQPVRGAAPTALHATNGDFAAKAAEAFELRDKVKHHLKVLKKHCGSPASK